ncbi:metallophosphoesterase [Bradyrhizobium sp.]|uniref:metallophosphoesterase n=1 Tax=Bradyrhizobium sp. TaxID=376 RepID=UPI00262C01C3|nr:metallophosphoesterase [Bradyrhizobium sp.]
MKLWIMSDVHLESTRGWDLPAVHARPEFDVMVMAGDLITRMERGVKWLLERVTDQPVIYVSGNHEPYGGDIDRTVEKARRAAHGTNVFVLQDDTKRIGDTIFAGATLWTDFNLFGNRRRAIGIAADRMNDFRKIRMNEYRERFRPGYALGRHQHSREFLERQMRKPRGDAKLVVVTHHAPVHDLGYLIAPPEAEEKFSDEEMLTAAFRSDLSELMRPQPAVDGKGPLRPANIWVHGHTHESFDAVVGSTRVVSNAKGYGPWPGQELTWDNPHFDVNFVIEV